ncbi:Lipase maturation factor 2 [Cucumis melo var. makuwa]|uniref:Lipase maturation factor 2 n=1 Tax=Cucumis melo var. makuwa TaxID=1194695 RepID=A0A5D3CW38_CUCMM|nr:Lipase maturation factor 2 [Cucumis melo var. makuwa]
MSQPPFHALSVSATHNVPIIGFQIHKLAATLAINPNLAISSHAGVMLGVNVVDRSAEAAARRPPPPPPKEKKDPNLSGVQAKVLASKKRKEALKEATAKLRAKGKPVDQPPPE